MFDFILNRLSPEMIIAGTFGGAFLVFLSTRWPERVFSLGFPVLIFSGQLKAVFPISVSATAALFPLCAFMGSLIRSRKLKFGNCEKAFLLLGLLIGIGVTYTPSSAYGLQKAILFNFMALPIVILSPYIIKDEKNLKKLLSTITITLVIFVILSLILSQRFTGIGRESALLDITVAAQYLGIAIGIFMMKIFLGERGIFKKTIYLILTSIALILLLKTGTRAAFLALIILSLFLIWFLSLNSKIFYESLLLKGFLVGFIFLAFLVATPFFFKNLIPIDLLEKRIGSFHGMFSDFSSLEMTYWQNSRGRALNFNCAVEGFLKRPVFGLGTGGFKSVLNPYLPAYFQSQEEGHPTYPHNMFLEIMCEQGILGLILIGYIFYNVWKMIKKFRHFIKTKGGQAHTISAVTIIFIFGFLVSMASLDLPRMMILWWGLGLVLSAHKIYFPKTKYNRVFREIKYKSNCDYTDI